jgi:hypothetical protein
MKSINEITLKLFKAIHVQDNSFDYNDLINNQGISQGFLLHPAIIREIEIDNLQDIIRYVTNVYLTKKFNKTFQKSWLKIQEASIQQLVTEQIAHYFTTYGYEALGIEGEIYIPWAKLDIPQLEVDDFSLIYIDALTETEIVERIKKVLSSGIALSSSTMDYYVELLKYFKITDISFIKNRELKIRMGWKPTEPVEFLRYIIYRLTGETLLIKNDDLIQKIISNEHKVKNDKIFKEVRKEFVFFNSQKLSQIFFRYRKLFLALKKGLDVATKVNLIRKLADTYKIPYRHDLLNTLLSKEIETNTEFYLLKDSLEKELDKCNTFRKLRLVNSLNQRLLQSINRVYFIRNGKTYTTKTAQPSFKMDKKYMYAYKATIMQSIYEDIVQSLGDKKIYVDPKQVVDFGLPSSEKTFMGNLPNGTKVTVKNDLICGVYWNNVDRNRIDLDLALLSISGKTGWDGSFRHGNKAVLFSGDMTDAKEGASELFYFKNMENGTYLMTLNYYNYDSNIPVLFDFMIASEKPEYFGKNYMLNPNNVILQTNDTMTEKQKTICVVKVKDGIANVVIYVGNSGNLRTSKNAEYMEIQREYFIEKLESETRMSEILDNLPKECFIDNINKADIVLTPNRLNKDSLIQLMV